MKVATKIPTLETADGNLKKVSTSAYTPKNYRRVFYNQAIPLLSHFANKGTEIVLYLLSNADSNNMIYCTYADIMRDCNTTDRGLIASVFRDLTESETLVQVSQSHYMLNPAIAVQGNNQKFGLIANTFNSILWDKKNNSDSEGESTNA